MHTSFDQIEVDFSVTCVMSIYFSDDFFLLLRTSVTQIAVPLTSEIHSCYSLFFFFCLIAAVVKHFYLYPSLFIY